MRLPPPDPATFNARQRAVFDSIASGPRGGVRGPLAIWLHRPELADKAQALGEYCRYGTLLEPACSELAILVTARIWSSEYEWAAHKPFALKAGLSPEVIDAVRDRRPPILTDERQAAVYAVATELNLRRSLSDATYSKAESVLGANGLVDLIGILGYYTLISMSINAFEVPPPPGAEREMEPNNRE